LSNKVNSARVNIFYKIEAIKINKSKAKLLNTCLRIYKACLTKSLTRLLKRWKFNEIYIRESIVKPVLKNDDEIIINNREEDKSESNANKSLFNCKCYTKVKL